MSSEQNTAYLVELTSRAALDLEALYGYIGADNSHAAMEWYNRLEDLIFSLEHLPNRGMHVPEDSRLLQLLYGNKPHIYRVIYGIDHAALVVRIAHIRHGAQTAFRPRDLVL